MSAVHLYIPVTVGEHVLYLFERQHEIRLSKLTPQIPPQIDLWLMLYLWHVLFWDTTRGDSDLVSLLSL